MGKPKIKQLMDQHKEICPKCDRQMIREEQNYKCMNCGMIKGRGKINTSILGRQLDSKSKLYL